MLPLSTHLFSHWSIPLIARYFTTFKVKLDWITPVPTFSHSPISDLGRKYTFLRQYWVIVTIWWNDSRIFLCCFRLSSVCTLHIWNIVLWCWIAGWWGKEGTTVHRVPPVTAPILNDKTFSLFFSLLLQRRLLPRLQLCPRTGVEEHEQFHRLEPVQPR